MKVLVTGSRGFIGGYMVAALQARGHTVVGAGTRQEIGSTAVRALRPVEVILHLGGQSSTARSLRDPVGDFVDNAMGTVEVAELARLLHVPVVFSSTVKINTGVDGLITPLGRSKTTAEEYLRMYASLYGVPSIINRISTVYGPGQYPTADVGWVTWITHQAMRGQEVTIAGDGTQRRDILYITDLVRLLVDQVEHTDRWLQNGTVTYASVGGGRDNTLSVNELVNHLRDTYGDRFIVRRASLLPGELGQVQGLQYDPGDDVFAGWTPLVGWRDGIAQLRNWLTREVHTAHRPLPEVTAEPDDDTDQPDRSGEHGPGWSPIDDQGVTG